MIGCGSEEPRRLMAVMIAFLYNHDQIHHVAHCLPIALALAKVNPGLNIDIVTTNEPLRSEVRRLIDRQLMERIRSGRG